MQLVLLSGGSGKRLWPLSNDSRSKQFLKVLKHGDKYESMVQRVSRQIAESKISKHIYIATSKEQVEVLQNQIENPNLIIEPQRRDTFPAIALAGVYLFSKRYVSPDEVVCVLPVDSYVEDEFFKKLGDMERHLKNSDADIALMGVKPTQPSEKFGYIVPQSSNESAAPDQKPVKVGSFVEKPDHDLAQKLIDNGALWNCGVFAFKLEYLINSLIERGISVSHDDLFQNYQNLRKISFDYEILEKTNNIIAVPYDGAWKDLGTWNSLTEEIDDPVIGKAIVGPECSNVHLINELDIPVAVLGIHDAVVVASSDGILVSDKNSSQNIKEISNHFDARPMYEERRWGWHRILDYSSYDDGRNVLTKRVRINSNKNISYHYHELRTEVWTILSGSGHVLMDGEIKSVKAGDVLSIPPRTKHSIKANDYLEFIEVQSGYGILYDDIIRLCLHWEEVVAHT
jgi:mannose-1-phosphate guanylyltransferase